MKEITAENTRYIYSTRVDGLPAASPVGFTSNGETHQIEMGDYADSLPKIVPFFSNAFDFRLVLIPSFFHPGSADVHYLFWNDGTDLTAVDARVVSDTYSDDDFSGSIRTEYQVTECEKCHHKWHSLVVDAGNPYLGAPGLLQEKISRSRVLLCPNCQSVMRQFVVKVFAQASAAAA